MLLALMSKKVLKHIGSLQCQQNAPCRKNFGAPQAGKKP